MVAQSLLQATQGGQFSKGLQVGSQVVARAQESARADRSLNQQGLDRASQLAMQKQQLEFKQEQLEVQKQKQNQMLVTNRTDSMLKILNSKTNSKFKNAALKNLQATSKFDANESITSELFGAAMTGVDEDDAIKIGSNLSWVSTLVGEDQKTAQDAIFKEIENGGTGNVVRERLTQAKKLREAAPGAQLERQKELTEFKTDEQIRLEKIKAGLKVKEGGKLTTVDKSKLTTTLVNQTKPIRKEFGRLSTIFGALPGLKEQKSGIADFLMIKALQQFFDSPRVTDSEVQMSRQGQGLINKIRTQVKNVQEGDLISEQLRKDMIKSVGVIKVATSKAEEQQLIPFSKRAKRSGLQSDEIFTPRQIKLLSDKGKVPKFEKQGKNISQILGPVQVQAVKRAVSAGASQQLIEKQLGILLTEDQFSQLGK